MKTIFRIALAAAVVATRAGCKAFRTLTDSRLKTAQGAPYDLIVVCIQEVDELLTEINEINAKISEMKDGVVCSRCRTVNSAGTVYCKSCGNRLKKGRAKGE